MAIVETTIQYTRIATALKILTLHEQLCAPIMLVSQPGIGKTELIKQIAKQTGRRILFWDNATSDPADFGVPFALRLEDGSLVTEWALIQELMFDEDTPTIIFFDEYGKGSQMMMNATSEIFLNRRIKNHYLPRNTWVVAATNRKEDRSGDNPIPRHIYNRITTIGLAFHIDDWREWAIEHHVDPRLVAFSNFRPALMCDFDPVREVNATPRQWTWVGQHLNHFTDASVRLPIIGGRVGSSHAAEFEAFLRVCDEMPNPDLVILDPEKAPIPSSPAGKYAIAGALSYKATPETFEAICTYMNRIPEKDMGVMCIRDAVRVNKKIVDTKAFGAWAVKNQQVLSGV